MIIDLESPLKKNINSVKVIEMLGQKTLSDAMKNVITLYLIMITKPKFWDNKIGFFSVILIPVTIIVSLYIF